MLLSRREPHSRSRGSHHAGTRQDYVNYRGEAQEYWVKARHDASDRAHWEACLRGQGDPSTFCTTDLPAYAPKHASMGAIIRGIQDKVYARTNTKGKGVLSEIFQWFGTGTQVTLSLSSPPQPRTDDTWQPKPLSLANGTPR